MGRLVIPADVEGDALVCQQGLSFWGGVDPESGRVIDAHHPQHGETLAGRVVFMPTSRGSCSGSGVLLALALNGRAPSALVFRTDEDILTLGALIAARMFDRPIAVVRLSPEDYDGLAQPGRVRVTANTIARDALTRPLVPVSTAGLALSESDRAMLAGRDGRAVALAMETLCTMAALHGAEALIDVSRVHIDGCIYHSPANLRFAETMAAMDARVRVPTTMNAISVDRANWRSQAIPPAFGEPASRLADAYVRMGAQPTFTCAPYQLADGPARGEDIGWSESNAVIYANSVLGARTAKVPDYLDLCIALTGRAPKAGMHLTANRRPLCEIHVSLPAGCDDAVWPLLGWLAGQTAPDRIPRLTGLETAAPRADDLRALCAAFGTTSAAPMLHIAGVTPEADEPADPDTPRWHIGRSDFARAWRALNSGDAQVDLVSLGSPHFSLEETHRFADLMAGARCHDRVSAVVTLGRGTLETARADGTVTRLEQAGVQVLPDLCWCSITEPLFPPTAEVLMTNSGKYAHYAPGLHGRRVRFGSLAECARAAQSGRAPEQPPAWLT